MAAIKVKSPHTEGPERIEDKAVYLQLLIAHGVAKPYRGSTTDFKFGGIARGMKYYCRGAEVLFEHNGQLYLAGTTLTPLSQF